METRHLAGAQGVTGGVLAGTENIIGSAVEEVARVNQWILEGRTLAPHLGPSAEPVNPRTGKPYNYNRPGLKGEAEAEATSHHLKGALRRLFIQERTEGWLGPVESIVEEGGLLAVLSVGILHGGSVEVTADPQTGRAHTTVHASATETAEKAVPEIPNIVWDAIKAFVSNYGLRLAEILGGAALVLFALVTLARGGEAPPLPVVG